MVQAHHAVARAGGRERLIECREGLGTQCAAGRSRDAAVEQHDAPAPEVDESAHHERLAIECAAHGLRLVVVAGQAQHRGAKIGEQTTEVGIAARVILHDVAGNQECIGRPLVGARVRERRLECRQCLHPTQRLVLIAVQVRVGEMRDAHNAHDRGSLAERSNVLQ